MAIWPAGVQKGLSSMTLSLVSQKEHYTENKERRVGGQFKEKVEGPNSRYNIYSFWI